MRTDPGKVFGIVVLLLATLLAMGGTLWTTNASVLDTDPVSYVVVVMLMLFLFIIFSLKENLKLNKNRRAFVIGTLVFVLYLIVLSYSRIGLSSVFATFRIDALIIPLALISFITILFGFSGLRELKYLVVYSLFMSPLILMPLLGQNQAFAVTNAVFVYDVLKSFGVPVTLNGITITSQVNTSISIASTCAPIGTFVALVMFLIPLAYLYEGSFKRKMLWILSGFVLMLVLNFARMFGIAYYWAYYGLTQAIALFHLFAGQILFYVAIIVMFLLATKYGLQIARLRKGQLHQIQVDFARWKKAFGVYWIYVIVLGFVGLLFSLPYLHSVYASPTFFYTNLSTIGQNTIYHAIGLSFADFSSNTIKLKEQNYTETLAILNGSNTNNATYVVATYSNIPLPGAMVSGYSKISSAHSFMLRNGIRLTSVVGYSGNQMFDVNYFAAPLNFSSQYVSVNYEFIKLIGSGAPSCTMLTYRSIGLFNYIESLIYNALNGQLDYSNNGVLCTSYTVASHI